MNFHYISEGNYHSINYKYSTNVAITLVTILISFTVHVVITLVNVEIMIVNVYLQYVLVDVHLN